MADAPTALQGAPNPRALAESGRDLAHIHARWTIRQPGRRRMRSPAEHLRGSAHDLSRTYDVVAAAAAEGRELTPGGHWLLDNFYLVRDQRSEVLRALRGPFFRRLPRLSDGPFEGQPRVLAVADQVVELVDNAVDRRSLLVFLEGYQDELPLTVAELWALPVAIRLVLLRNLRTLANRVRAAHFDRQRAHDWSETIGERSREDPVEGLLAARDMLGDGKDASDAFLLDVIERLASWGTATRPVVEWLERRLASRRVSVQEVTRRESQRQISVANAITALRWTAEARWGRLVESASRLERILRRDPAGVYPRMDFPTRDRYRHVVEDLARHAPGGELDIASELVDACREAAENAPEEGRDDPAGDPREMGYHLIGDGVRAFERRIGYRPPLRIRIRRWAYEHPALLYLGTIGLLTAATLAGVLAYGADEGIRSGALFLVAVAALLPLLDFSVAVTNRLVAWAVPPKVLPKMDAERGIGEEHRTLVVVPTLLRSPEDAAEQIEQLEIHARANPSPLLRFALLSDFGDAPRKRMPGDDETLRAAVDAVERLNRRDRDGWGDRFFVLHRERRWNAAEGLWMGWERKRGKLEELNLLLRDPEADTSYETFGGDFAGVAAGDRIRYVITLDADTQLPPGAALDLVRTAAHPLNRPVYDRTKGRVTRGFGILQPRVSISPRGSSRTAFARIFSGHVGIDPYTTAVSDVYQDLFGEGIFTGKGLYDVDAFRTALGDAVPPNTVLSHDLLESNFARAALVTDVELFDDYPARYVAFAKRMHRWVRGDWQIAPWLLPRVRRSDGRKRRNPVSLLGRWRIFDNLRRSLTGPALLAFLLAGWVVLPGSPLVWTIVAFAALAFPVYSRLTAAVLTPPRHGSWKSWFEGVDEDLRLGLVQTGLTLVVLPHLAIHALDAALRAVWRITVSRRRLLEWTTARDAEQASPDTPRAYLRFMMPSVLWAVGVGALVALRAPRAWPVAAPFLVAWAAAPWIAWWLGRPGERAPEALTPDQARWLRAVGHRTWMFFDRFVGPATGWLPPDNVQETPWRGVAERTSPTNIGLGLLATQVAFDFGWIGREELLRRLEGAADSIDALDRHEGHLFNWYATDDGRTLWPRYVSTVDSGNFVASLVTLAQALADAYSAPWPSPAQAEGLRDDVRLLGEHLDATSEEPGELGRTRSRLEAAVAPLRSDDPVAWHHALGEVAVLVEALRDRWSAGLPDGRPAGEAEAPAAGSGTGPHGLPDQEAGVLVAEAPAAEAPRALDPVGHLVGRLERRVAAARGEVAALIPWLETGDPLPGPVAGARTLAELDEALRELPDDPRARRGQDVLEELLGRSSVLAAWCWERVEATRFEPLYDRTLDLFAIGFNVDSLQRDPGHYDLLASEARLASFLAVAKGDVPVDHWFRLGRTASKVEDGSVLLSWSGTLFEYLMPVLFTGSWPGTLLDETCEVATEVQVRYGARAGLPWGISESAYNTLNLELDYQYRAFGVPGLGLKRGLSRDYVAAPYASVLATMVAPARACENLQRLAADGALGPFGFYDAVDYTPERLPQGRDRAVVATWMAHHQAMVLLALANVLDGKRVQARFQASPLARSAELLLQERIPRRIETTDPHPLETSVDPGEREPAEPPVAYVPADALDAPSPRGALLSNGRFTTFLTQSGTGFSRWRDWELTRWEPDRTTDPLGVFFYLRDLESGAFWSVTHQPTRPPADRLDTWLHVSKVQGALVHDWIEAYVEVGVSPEDDVEVRRLTVTNYGTEPRTLDVTSYVEIALAPLGADRAHPAFSKLFVETEVLPETGALLANRRPRREGDRRLWLFHTAAEGTELAGPAEALEYETDRARFVGRGRGLRAPAALDPGARLSRATGAVLDPIFAIRRPLELAPREKAVVSFALGVASTREDAIRLADRYDNPTAAQRALELATAYGPAELQHLDMRGADALRLQELGAAIVQADPRLRAPAPVVAANTRQQAALWAYGISGDLPLVVVRVESTDQMARVREVIRAFEFWTLRGLELDVVFLNEHPPSYAEGLQDRISEAIAGARRGAASSGRGALFVLRGDQMPVEDRTLVLAVAHAVFDGGLPAGMPSPRRNGDDPNRGVGDSGGGPGTPTVTLPARPACETVPARGPGESAPPGDAEAGTGARELDNGYGGFTPEGHYEVRLPPGAAGPRRPPLPWINVLANPRFGCTATEAGGGYTWSVNSRENRLTPWCNDPVRDRPGEVVYVRDDDRGTYGSVTAAPTPLPGRYRTVHAWGSTRYVLEGEGLDAELTVFVPPGDPVKVARLTLANTSDAPRRLSVFRYVEWVLGVFRSDSARHVVTARDEATGALLARNPYNQEFAGRVAFSHVVAPDGAPRETAGDRHRFLGPGRDVNRPLAVETAPRLDGRVGAGLDPCAAHRVSVELAPGETGTVTFLLGEAATVDEVRELLARYGDDEAVVAALEETTRTWEARLGKVRVRTPDPTWNRLLDRWLLYQALACRIWGRSAFYQSGGAYGFRDQLQDAMAMVYVDPALTRSQILLHAAHQFVEGDVLHWWHPPTGRGIRTRITDDLLWLPRVTAFYVGATGDRAILDEPVGYLTARALEEGEDEAYLVPTGSGEVGDLYGHCCRALDRSLTAGTHGLPLMGAGDWNDGMNRVGAGGRGESVWLGFFLHAVLRDFVPICEARGDLERAMRYRGYSEDLAEALEQDGWDGEWYRRAFYDDGTPLGSATNTECRIDAIAQAWAVISGVAGPERARTAMDAAHRHLVDREAGIVRLLTPPFDRTPHDPGYIKGYPPGVRENGGQYTHGVLWLVRAAAEMGHGDRAAELFGLLNPLESSRDRAAADRYRVEPWVAVADVYGAEPWVGRGGWSWYTGSGAWMYRIALESILGFRLEGDRLRLRPAIPSDWPGFEIDWTPRPGVRWEIRARAEGEERRLLSATLDGRALDVVDGGVVVPMDGAADGVDPRRETGSGEAGHEAGGATPDGAAAVHRVELRLG